MIIKPALPLLMVSILLLPPITHAFTMENGSYIIEEGNVDFSEPKPIITPTQDINTQKPGVYQGENYTILSNPLSKNKNKPLVISISDLSINFGKIAPGEPITRTTTLTAESGSGYQILNIEDHELRNEQAKNIPDTTCDQGNCTILTPALWDNPLTYGFGYRCENIEGNACISIFESENHFRPVPNVEKKQTAQVIASHKSGEKTVTEAVFKVNIPQNQAKGVYKNTIKYIAAPTL